MNTAEQKTAEASARFRAIREQQLNLSQPAPKPPKFRVLKRDEYRDRPPVQWLVKGVLAGALCVIFGEAKAGKTFAAVDIACAVSRGVPWQGRRTRKGRVIYVAAEDGIGVMRRLDAYALHHGEHDVEVIDAAPIINKPAEITELLRSIDKADLIVIDTLWRTLDGEENNENWRAFAAGCDELRRKTGALILVVHHSGWTNTGRTRGPSSMPAAIDVELKVEKVQIAPLKSEITISRCKHGPEGDKFACELVHVPLGVDDDGDEYGSGVCVPAALDVKQLGPDPDSDYEMAFWAALTEMPGGKLIDVRKAALELMPDAPKSSGRSSMSKAGKRLIARGAVLIAGDRIWRYDDPSADLLGESDAKD